MQKYHKIQTVYLRDPANKHRTLLDGQFARLEFEYLAQNEWIFTEKVDGTNIRVSVGDNGLVIGGRTDNAQIPAFLLSRLMELFDADALRAVFDTPDFCLYGEGYGAKIQKGGGNYNSSGVDFVLFDVRVGDWWLTRESVQDVADKLGIRTVPIIGRGTLFDMVEMTRQGFSSQWGDFQAEGIVARPIVELFDRGGRRIITKVKCKDFT
jgi:ATP-dependent RNA circularization protein (DNA/RNA ligase family)